MENMKTWCVYCHTNKANGKKYIGITGTKPERRWQNGKNYSETSHFGRAIKKYGWDGFVHEVICAGTTQGEAESLEVELIARHKTQDPERGYNSAAGGCVNYGWTHSENTRQKMSEAQKGRVVSESVRTKMSEQLKEKWEDDEYRNKMSKARQGRTLSEEHREKISKTEKGKVFSDAHKAKISYAKKKQWENEEYRAKISGSNNYNARSVLCVETGAVYGSMTEAANDTGISNKNIYNACKGKNKTAGGLHWSYTEAVRVSA